MTSALEILGDLIPTKMVMGTEDDVADYAQRLGWHVEAIDPSAGLHGCFSKALQAGAHRILILNQGVRSAGGGAALRKLKELVKLLDTPFDAISLGTCVDSDESLASWGRCDTFKRAAGYEFVFETNCTCTIGTVYSSAYMMRYMQRAEVPDRAYTIVPELLLRAKDARPIRRAPTVVYDPYGRVSIPRKDQNHDILTLVAVGLIITFWS